MTCIAYHHKDKQVAVDSRIVSHGLTKSDSYDKTLENELGIWFFCGTAADTKDLCRLKHNDEVNPIPNCSAFLISEGKCYDVIVNKDGLCEYFSANFLV